ncbi:MAG: hypothetical protein RTV41_00345 [Candidatus Thorarchaeota archaeon]
MAKRNRAVPKEIAAFGERQFKETGAATVEVLRVKAAVMRKHFKKLKGITFLVAVVSLDRVRVYFFNAAGIMLVGENVEPSIYGKIRRASKLIAKFEKPKELTPEELRIEATQDLRDSLAKSIRRISRAFTIGEPPFPDIFITRAQPSTSAHSFGLQIGEKNELLFEEAALGEKSAEGIITRTAFLTLIENRILDLEISSIIGNGVALALLKGAERKAMLEKWRKKSKSSDSLPLVNHMITHALSYSNNGFSRILALLQQSPDSQSEKWIKAIEVIHEETHIAMGTEEYHTIKGFCETLTKPRKLEKRRHILEPIHLEPRVICDPTPLGIQLSASSRKAAESTWLDVDYIEGHGTTTFSVTEEDGSKIKSIDYWLNLEDVYPSSGGLVSHSKDIIRRALMKLGVMTEPQATFEGRVEFTDRSLKSTELAVLERLSSGNLEVLSNTLVGSPQAVGTLLKKGQIALLPGFNHIGVNHDFLIQGEHDKVLEVAKSCCLEASVFATDSETTAVVAAPASWKSHLLESVRSDDLSLWPIQSIKSPKNLLRTENPFPAEESVFIWSTGAT